MKIILFLILFSLSLSSVAEEGFESIAKKAVVDFIFTVNDNSADINIHSNWESLHEKMSEVAVKEVVNSILDDADNDSFSSSLLKIMYISSAAIILARISSGPVIISENVNDNKAVLYVKPYKRGGLPVYEITCRAELASSWFWGDSIKKTCQISNIDFPE